MKLFTIAVNYKLGPRSTGTKTLVVMAQNTECAYVDARAFLIDDLKFQPADFSVVKVTEFAGNVLVARA